MRHTQKQHAIWFLVWLLCIPTHTFGQQTVTQTAGPRKEKEPIRVEQLFGKWQSEDDGTVIEIGPLYKGDNSKLGLQGKHGWGGSYADGKLSFIRAVKAEEMDDKAPLWARQQVEKEGGLKWKLELTPDDNCSEIKLVGKWFRGELSWREEKDPNTGEVIRAAQSSGLYNNPVDVKYKRVGSIGETLEFRSRPTIIAWPQTSRAFSDYFYADNSLNTVSKGQPFVLFVRLPQDEADNTGNTLEVSFTSAKTNRTAKVQLTRSAYSSNAPAIYRRDEPIIIADPGSGVADIGLKAENEDKITVSYRGATDITFVVYNSPVQQGIAANEEGFRAMLALYNPIISESRDPKAREAAHRKILLINNARHLINDYEPKPLPALYIDINGTLKDWDKMTDLTRFFIGRQYLDLLEVNTDLTARDRGPAFDKVRDQYFATLGITLTGVQELQQLGQAFEQGHRAYEQMFFSTFLPQFSMGLFQVVAFTHHLNPVSQKIEQFLILIYGVDILGQPVDKTTKILTAINLGSDLFLSAANFGHWLTEFTNRSSAPSALQLGKTLSESPKGGGNFVDALKPENAVGRSFYEKAIKVDTPPTAVFTALQKRPDTCLLMVINGHLREAGLPYIPEDLAVAYAESLGIYRAGGGTNILRAAEYLEDFGAKVNVVSSNLNAIKAALKRGLKVNLGARKHALRITDVLTDSDNSSWVFFEDSWNGNLWKIKAQDFCDIVDKDPTGGFAKVMFVDLKGVVKGKGPFILNPEQ